MISAPGKILFLGGYAVLDYYPALSIAVVDGRGAGAGAASIKKSHRLFSGEFSIDLGMDPDNPLSALIGAEKAHRVSISAFATALSYFRHIGHKPEPLEITLENSPVFGRKEEKSGLGSSAASTVALIAALMDGNGFDIEESRQTIHKLGQISHALATEKTGSGFDVATSAYGTIEYVRFERNLLKVSDSMAQEEFSEMIGKLVKTEWPQLSVKKMVIEPYGLLAFNIRGGKTSTISSVKAVRKLMEHTPELYQNMIRGQVSGEKEVFLGLAKKDAERIRDGMQEARAYQRLLSDWVGRIGMMNFDPIEPPALSALIEQAEKLPGIIAGRCPGSGGFDSVAFLTEGNNHAAEITKIGKSLGLELEHLELKVTSEGVRRI